MKVKEQYLYGIDMSKPIPKYDPDYWMKQWSDKFPPLNLHNFPNHTPMSKQIDLVNHPPHYTEHPSGIECIQITEHMGFNLGNALKYIWRCDLKKDAIEDLKKAVWYIHREIEKRNVKST